MSSSRSRRLARRGLIAAAALSIAAAPSAAFASIGTSAINYPTFADSSTLSLNGTAEVVESAGKSPQKILRLTNGSFRQAGSAWADDKVDLTKSFETDFKVYLHHSEPGADGVAFLIQGVGPRALGGWGGGIGYRGIKPSVAVEFDTFQNAPDPNGNHLAVVLGGNPDYQPTFHYPNFDLYGKPFRARVTYDASTHALKVYASRLFRGSHETLMLQRKIDLAAGIGADSAWVGFTGATGSITSKQDIYSWSVTPGA